MTAAATTPKHVLTMAALLGWGGSTVSAALAAPYLSWSFNTSPQNLGQVESAGINANVYTNGVLEYPCSGCSELWSTLQANPKYIARDCSRNILYRGSAEYVNVTLSGWYPFWSSNVATQYTIVKPLAWQAAYSDDSAAPEFLGLNPCGATEASFTQGIAHMLASTSKPIIFNGLSVTAKQPDERTLYSVANVIGGLREDCYSGNNDFGHSGDFVFTMRDHFYGASIDDWTQTENDELYAATVHKLFFCLSNAVGAATASVPARTYVFASFMLTYDSATSALWEKFAPSSSNGLTVYPETGLVALNPVVSTPAAVAGLAVNGLYAREYKDCYYRGTDEGACAAVVNPTLTTRAFPYSKYHHTLVLGGGGVLEGGTVGFKGSAPPASLSSGSAVIAFP